MYLIIMRSIYLFLNAIELLVLVRCVLSFVARGSYGNPIVNIVNQVTEPLLAPVRELIYKLNINTGMLDFSPIVLFLIIRIIRSVIF